ncbi:VanZ family protein [Kitasatospora sp. DSM 101779]|uniref:VanZ family protein n=1 Tax=Kitasatospora sp. DSM 101779 TaxID=2853165 RepID=UPI0021D8D72E|nr:VanZ family protein [Kitasatospora sp. DSM 101779]MCU7826334.1 VanZ family protein [Kitasatospora sp. DSM 101779]
MDRTAALPAAARRTRRIVLAGPTVLGAALVAFLAQRPLRHHHAGWHGWLGTVNGVVFLTAAGLPLAALVVRVLARRRTAVGSPPELARRRSLAEVGIVYGTVPWVWMILLPGAGAGTAPRRVSAVPLRDLVAVLSGAPVTATVQVVGNLLVFAALGFFAPVRFAALASVPRILALGAGCSVLVEAAQYVLWLDRVSSVDDVLLNAAGAGLAALASHRWWRSAADTSAVTACSRRAAAGPPPPARRCVR